MNVPVTNFFNVSYATPRALKVLFDFRRIHCIEIYAKISISYEFQDETCDVKYQSYYKKNERGSFQAF